MRIFIGLFCLVSLLATQNVQATLYPDNPDLKYFPNITVRYIGACHKRGNPFGSQKDLPSPKRAKTLQTSSVILPTINLESFEDRNNSDLSFPQITSAGTNIILYDLDATLVRPKYHLYNFDLEDQNKLLDKFYEGEYSTLENGSIEEFTKFRKYLTTIDIFSHPSLQKVLVEPCAKDIILSLERQGAFQIAITARSFEYADYSYKSLKNLGIDFAELSGLKNEILPTKDQHIGIKNGIVSTGNVERKVEFVPLIVNLLKQNKDIKEPINIHYVDDSELEVDAFQQHPIKTNTTIPVQIQSYLYSKHDKFIDGLIANPQIIYDQLTEMLEDYRKSMQVAAKNAQTPT